MKIIVPKGSILVKHAPKKNLKQKLAVALSVVNALNMVAPIALPYVNVARNVRATLT